VYYLTEEQLFALLRNTCPHAVVLIETGLYTDDEAAEEAARYQIRELEIERELLDRGTITSLKLQQKVDVEQ
jgi:hypothetical protein